MSPPSRDPSAPFVAPRWLRNPHQQTLLANKPLRWPPAPPTVEGTLTLPDGDIVRVVRNKASNAAQHSPIVVVLHGLAGGYESAYARDLFSEFARSGLEGHLLHFRGCGGLLNRLPRGYHAGDTGDLAHYIKTLRSASPERPVYAVGYSLGANVLLKHLGTTGLESGLDAAVAVSVPFRLEDACESISHGFARLYHRVLLARLKQLMRDKFSRDRAAAPFDLAALYRIRDLRTFDDRVTAPMHGFRNVEHYYRVSSCRQYLGGIRTPTLILHAADDPFQSHAGIPPPRELASTVQLALSPHGGHVGFLQSSRSGWGWESWLAPRIGAFLRRGE
ncbi:MAG: hydrolase [Pseudomonadota bacterium]